VEQRNTAHRLEFASGTKTIYSMPVPAGLKRAANRSTRRSDQRPRTTKGAAPIPDWALFRYQLDPGPGSSRGERCLRPHVGFGLDPAVGLASGPSVTHHALAVAARGARLSRNAAPRASRSQPLKRSWQGRPVVPPRHDAPRSRCSSGGLTSGGRPQRRRPYRSGSPPPRADPDGARVRGRVAHLEPDQPRDYSAGDDQEPAGNILHR
jgi:hypothetical protein